jgi:hypothetical protein
MLRNIFFLLAISFSFVLTNCAVGPGYNTNPGGDVRIRNTYPPGGVQSRDEKTGIGVDVYSEETHRGSKTTITPFRGESPDYNKGWRREKKRMKALKFREERQQAIELAREDASMGDIRNYQDVPGKFVWLYNEEFDRVRQNIGRSDRHNYERDEYHRGQEDFRDDNPQYGETARIIEQIKRKARQDAHYREYNPQGIDPRFLRDYDEAYEKALRQSDFQRKFF